MDGWFYLHQLPQPLQCNIKAARQCTSVAHRWRTQDMLTYFTKAQKWTVQQTNKAIKRGCFLRSSRAVMLWKVGASLFFHFVKLWFSQASLFVHINTQDLSEIGKTGSVWRVNVVTFASDVLNMHVTNEFSGDNMETEDVRFHHDSSSSHSEGL